ncbi:melanocyte-stimulating hormone receptor-like [Oculina patagonica]
MAILTNFTGDAKHETYEKLFCSPGVTASMHGQLIFLSVLHVFLTITTTLGNTLILAALYKESSLHAPSKLLLCCLATSDLFVGIISEPLAITYWMSAVNENWNTCYNALFSSFIASYLLCGMSLLTLSAISVDRLLALLLGLRYRQTVSLKRSCVIIITFWTVSTVCAMMYLRNYRITIWYSHIVIAVSLVTSVLSYTKIFLTLRHHQIQVQNQIHEGQPNQPISPLNIARYRKAVSSALWLQLTLVLCYLPHGIVTALSTHTGQSSSVILLRQFSMTLVYLNSTLNPILYCWKITEVRQAVKDTIRQLFCT